MSIIWNWIESYLGFHLLYKLHVLLMWSEKHSFAGCLSWNPTRMVTSEQCGGCPDTAKCHPGAECHLSEKTSDSLFFFSCFFVFSVAPERCERIYRQQLPTKKSLCWYHEILCDMEIMEQHRRSQSITRFEPRGKLKSWTNMSHKKPSKPIF